MGWKLLLVKLRIAKEFAACTSLQVEEVCWLNGELRWLNDELQEIHHQSKDVKTLLVTQGNAPNHQLIQLKKILMVKRRISKSTAKTSIRSQDEATDIQGSKESLRRSSIPRRTRTQGDKTAGPRPSGLGLSNFHDKSRSKRYLSADYKWRLSNAP